MTRLKAISLLLAVVVSCTSAVAQKKGKAKKVQKPKVTVIEKTAAEILFEEMLPSTARVLFADSTVTDKGSFLKAIPLGDDAGKVMRYDDFFNTKGNSEAFVYINGFGNKIFYADTTATGNMRLYTADKLGSKWSQPQMVEGLGEDFTDITSPFLMPDGNTLYFAAKSERGLGGYDIYVTRYNAEEGAFYKPENLALPYNSPANDYFCIIDEVSNLGWLVTDRSQPEGKVCVYTFVPPSSRQTYSDIDDERTLAGLASISSIKDTWHNRGEREKALTRIKELAAAPESSKKADGILFVVNDEKTYTSLGDFKSPRSRERFIQLMEIKKDLEKSNETLENLRDSYSQETGSAKANIAKRIVKLEKQTADMQTFIHNEEKEIRRAEQ